MKGGICPEYPINNRKKRSPMLVEWRVERCVGINTGTLMKRVRFVHHDAK